MLCATAGTVQQHTVPISARQPGPLSAGLQGVPARLLRRRGSLPVQAPHKAHGAGPARQAHPRGSAGWRACWQEAQGKSLPYSLHASCAPLCQADLLAQRAQHPASKLRRLRGRRDTSQRPAQKCQTARQTTAQKMSIQYMLNKEMCQSVPQWKQDRQALGRSSYISRRTQTANESI